MMGDGTDIVLLTPSLAIEQAKTAYQIVKMMADQVLVKGVDFGVIPGTEKPTLYKPGAEKLCRAFGYNPVLETVDKVEKWDDESPLFHYEIRCRLVRIEDGKDIATGIGSCNSKENKYRWRWLFDNQAVELGIDTTGLVKKTKNGRNGKPYTQFRVPNDDIFSLVNTIEKMACKRALIAAVLIGVGASEFFTQDVEDLRDFGAFEDGVYEVVDDTPKPSPKPQPESKIPARDSAPAVSNVDWTLVWKTFSDNGWKPGDKNHIETVFPDGTSGMTTDQLIAKIYKKPTYGKPTTQPVPYIKVLPGDIEPGDVINPEDGGMDIIISSIEKLDAGTILVKSEIGAVNREIKYDLSQGLAHVVGGNKLIAYKRNPALAPKNGAGHPLWAGYESEQDKAS